MKKLLFITLLLVFGSTLSVNAQGATLQDLQVQIQALLSQIAQLQAQLNQSQGGTVPSAFCYNFQNSLRLGDTGSDVRALQQALKEQSLYFGNITGSFDVSLFQAAVLFQEKYQREILAPFSITRGTGFVGRTTKAQLNKLYACGVPRSVITGIVVTSPQPNQVVSFPLKITGYVNGNGWAGLTGEVGMVEYVNGGRVVASARLKATTPWTQLPTSFEAIILSDGGAPLGAGTLVFSNENPSGLPEKDREFRLPIRQLPPQSSPSITVLYPNGGETFNIGNTVPISWVAQEGTINCIIGPCLPTVDINLLTRTPCTGVCPLIAPIEIAKGYLDNGSPYQWTIPSSIGIGEYVVRVTFHPLGAGSPVADQSNTPFKITGVTTPNLPPVIDGVTGPTKLNVSQLGTWIIRAHDPENGTLSYSVLWGDEQPGIIAQASPSRSGIAAQTATFTHVYSQSGTYTPRFTVSDLSQSAQTSLSVVVGEADQPSITVLSPNGGEVWPLRSNQKFTWNTSKYSGSVSITLVPANAPSYALGAFFIANTGSYDWLVSTKAGTMGSFKIRVCTIANSISTSVCDESDNYFSIVSATTTTSSTEHIKGNPNAEITLEEWVGYQEPFSARFEPTINQILSEYSSKVNLRVKHFPFSVIHPMAAKAAEATECVAGQNQKYFWKMHEWLLSGNVYRSISVSSIKDFAATLRSDGLNVEQFNQCLDLGVMSGVVKKYIQEGTAKKITGIPTTFVIRNRDGLQEKVSGAVTYDTLKKKIDSLLLPQASVTVLSPNGGETWKVGSAQTITYRLTNWSESSILIYLEQYHPISSVKEGNVNSSFLIAQTKGENFTYTIPTFVQPGNTYKIKVCNKFCIISDSSDNYFSIVSGYSKSSIIILAPREGEVIIEDIPYTIQWTAEGLLKGSMSLFETRANGGVPWKFIGTIPYSENIQNYSYAWTPTDVSEKLLSISHISSSGKRTEDFARFTVQEGIESSITVLVPNGGEKLVAGQTYTIHWKTAGKINKVLLSVCEEEQCGNSILGTNYIGVDAVLGSFEWKIPESASYIPSDRLKIRAFGHSGCMIIEGSGSTCSYDRSAVDTSDNFFSIVSSTVSQPSITVLSPNGGEELVSGQKYTIQWRSTGVDRVGISLLTYDIEPAGRALWITQVPATDGKYVWEVPQTYFPDYVKVPGSKFKLLLNSSNALDTSDNYFSIFVQ